MRKSNYDKQPSTHIDGKAVIGWDNIVQTLSKAWADEPVWAIDLYPGTYEEDFINAFAKTGRKIINTRDLMRPEEEIRQLTERFMTDDVLFGYMSNIRLHEYFDNSKLINSKFKIEEGPLGDSATLPPTRSEGARHRQPRGQSLGAI